VNPVPWIVMLLPTGPDFVVGDVTVTFGTTVKFPVWVFMVSVTLIWWTPYAAVGTSIPNLAPPDPLVVTVDGTVAISVLSQ